MIGALRIIMPSGKSRGHVFLQSGNNGNGYIR